jgi:hypothetical protein
MDTEATRELKEQLREERLKNAGLMRDRAELDERRWDRVDESFKTMNSRLFAIEQSTATNVKHEDRIKFLERCQWVYFGGGLVVVFMLEWFKEWGKGVLWK